MRRPGCLMVVAAVIILAFLILFFERQPGVHGNVETLPVPPHQDSTQ